MRTAPADTCQPRCTRTLSGGRVGSTPIERSLMDEPSPYPLRLEGDLSPRLSRWLWLVKWVLAIPHFVVLFFLWIAFLALSVVALFAILFTGRCPRGIFDFNVGVMRWTWRVGLLPSNRARADSSP